jgi:hypothetical protein
VIQRVTEDSYLSGTPASESAPAAVEPTYTVGDRVKIEGYALSLFGFRTLYPIHRDGDLVAFVGVKSGFGKGWKLWPVQIAPEGARFQFQGAQPNTSNHDYLSTHCHKETAVERLKWNLEKGFGKFPTLGELKKASQDACDSQLALAKQMLESQVSSQETLKRQIAVLDKVLGEAMTPTAEEWTDLGAIKLKLTNELALREGNILRQREYVAKLSGASQTSV